MPLSRLHPEIVVVDELAHTNVEGSRNEKRWQDVMDLLDEGINVILPLTSSTLRVSMKKYKASRY